ncbi:MAG: hypothetical protein ACLVD8_26355 [Enterocloster sp.]|uniref:hypothetical protein n=1 Tax=Enterocloster sp. TaxID=2719315 RepID=UPI00399B815C
MRPMKAGARAATRAQRMAFIFWLSGVTIDEKADDKRQKNDEDQHNHDRDSRNAVLMLFSSFTR